jgi:hypothetical protein
VHRNCKPENILLRIPSARLDIKPKDIAIIIDQSIRGIHYDLIPVILGYLDVSAFDVSAVCNSLLSIANLGKELLKE